jgi:Bacteriophage tail sheath protein
MAKGLAAALQATGTSNAAVYFPQISIADPTSPHAPRLSSPSGAVAGMVARTDANRGVWVAPAGMGAQLMGVLSLPLAIDQTAAASLAAVGVNSIRSVPQAGIVVWAAQTVSSQDQWKYVPVRRLTLFIERSLVSGLQWAIFEPNDDPLWAQLAIQVSSFVSTLWHQGAFSGKTQQEGLSRSS